MKLLKAIYWRAYIVRLSCRWMFRFTLGDRVLFKGREYNINNGVCAPRWDLICKETLERVSGHESELALLGGIGARIRRFKAGYRFYMQNWYSIWVREGIKPWMRACRIWGKK